MIATDRSIDVLIFHGENSHLIERLIGSRSFLVFRPEKLLRVRHIFSVYSLIFFLVIVLRERNIKIALAATYIKYLAPKIVITYIDNSYLYQRVAYYLHHQIPFLAIQNGSRLLHRDHTQKKHKLFHDYLFVIGEYEVSQYMEFKHRAKKIIPVGSLRDSFYRSDVGNLLDSNRRYDICLVSQARESLYKNFPEQYVGFEKLLFFLNRFQLERGVKVCIALRRQSGESGYEWECNWYKSRISKVTLIENNQKAYSTYVACDQSDITLGLHSTALRESYGRGNKVLSCNFSGIDYYSFPIEDDVSINIFDYNLFCLKLDYLMSINRNDFFCKHKENINRMVFQGLSSPESLIVNQINLLL